MGGQELREEEKVWREVATGEARMTLMRKMIKEDLAFADLQAFGEDFNNKLKSIKIKQKTLYKKVSGTAMKAKLADEQELRRELLKIKIRMKKDLAVKYGERSRQYRRVVNNLNKMARNTKDKLNEKYNNKIEHLRKKQKVVENEDEPGIPEHLEEYADLSVFNRKEFEKVETKEYDVQTVGDIILNDDEKQVLKLHTKFSILEDLKQGGIDAAQEVSLAKLRMEKEKNKQYEDFTVEERKEDELMEATNRMIFNAKERSFDNRRRRATDLKQCSRVTLPKPLSTDQESKIEVRKRIQKEIYEKYRKQNTNQKGEQKTNLTKTERKGLKSLQERINKEEIVVMKTDKSGKFVITTPEEYLKMGEEHIKNDREITWEEVRSIERTVNLHTVAWDLMWKTGEDHGHQDRISRSRATRSGNQATLSLLFKDHKTGNKTRPVASGNESFNLGLSNGISEVLESVARSMKTPYSVISAEDLLARVNKFNMQWRATVTDKEEIVIRESVRPGEESFLTRGVQEQQHTLPTELTNVVGKEGLMVLEKENSKPAEQLNDIAEEGEYENEVVKNLGRDEDSGGVDDGDEQKMRCIIENKRCTVHQCETRGVKVSSKVWVWQPKKHQYGYAPRKTTKYICMHRIAGQRAPSVTNSKTDSGPLYSGGEVGRFSENITIIPDTRGQTDYMSERTGFT